MILSKKNIPAAELENEFQDILDKILKEQSPAGFSDALIYMLSELYANINEHSRAKNATINISIRSDKMQLKLSDNGIGIRKSYLANNTFAKDDKSAILLALSGISTKKSNERAFGLSSIRQLVESENGKMEITSGKSKVIITKAKMEFSEQRKTQKGVSILIQTGVRPVNIYEVIK